ncbi:crotonobetaine/carnitine-CoA ligase [Campylobacter sp.]|uniref:crotonobetaine/carnitine-CoA ligase n=1 Tax=Campylobacter sp. TaxID=205 RepID=UPI0027110C27|nr:crotonobetaine/carnitine-CoA ligase [Campylobacter sp.]
MDMIGKRTLREYFDELAQTYNDKTAIVFEDANAKISSLSYKELNEQINKAANLLVSLGVKKEDLVAIHMLNSIEYIVNFFAIAKLGAVAVPVNANYVYADTLFIVEKTKPVLVITQPEFVEIYEHIEEKNFKFKNGILVARADKNAACKHINYEKEIEAQSTKFKYKKYELDTLATAEIIFTSGTSSFPKGVMITHYNLIFAGYYTSWQINLNQNDTYLTPMPLWHIDAQCTVMMPTFSRGGTFVLLERYSAHKFWDQIIAHKATITECIPKMICTMMVQPVKANEKSHSIREMLFYLNISANELKKFMNRFNIKSVLSSYGMSETVVGLIGDRPSETRKFPSIGRVGFCYEAKIVGKNGKELKANRKGEILIKGERGKTIFNGYYKDEDATKRALSDEGWLHTGDIGYADEDEYFYFVDRDINLIKVAGENVSSVELETYLGSHEKILEAAIIGIPDGFNNELIKACVVLNEGEILSENEVKEFCAAGLAKFKIPSFVQFYSSLPRTCTGKVRKNILRSEHLKENS